METITLKVQNLCASYGRFRIADVSFELKSGHILGLVGRSGSGKSTLLKTLIGIKRQEAGTISVLVDGAAEPMENVIGYSSQGNSLYSYLTLRENIFTFGSLNGVAKKDLVQRMEVLAKRLELERYLDKKILQLSGGTEKRADLAVTLIHDPRIIILDEPFNGLDIALQRFIWRLLHELSAQGKIIIVTSHLLSDIQNNCNQFGLVDNGRYFDTELIIDTIRKSGQQSLEFFLERLFSKELSAE